MTIENDAETDAAAAELQSYGVELIMDLHGCDPITFTRNSIDMYFSRICGLINMEKCDVYFWDDVDVSPDEQQTLPHTKGTSAVCFILTSTIVVHTLDLLDAVYINVFSCKAFNPKVTEDFTVTWFRAQDCQATFIERQ